MAREDCPIAEIAFPTGFSEQMIFSHVFKRHVGQTPPRPISGDWFPGCGRAALGGPTGAFFVRKTRSAPTTAGARHSARVRWWMIWCPKFNRSHRREPARRCRSRPHVRCTDAVAEPGSGPSSADRGAARSRQRATTSTSARCGGALRSRRPSGAQPAPRRHSARRSRQPTGRALIRRNAASVATGAIRTRGTGASGKRSTARPSAPRPSAARPVRRDTYPEGLPMVIACLRCAVTG